MGAPLKPLYMWAGGKGRLLKHYAPLLPERSSYGLYVEPFFGGGALFGLLAAAPTPAPALIGDINTELVGLLKAIRDAPGQLFSDVVSLIGDYLAVSGKEARKAWYYELRSKYWAEPNPAQLFVLMRLGFNGIWQTSRASQGLYATPAGLLNHTTAEQIVDEDKLMGWHVALANTQIVAGSYVTIDVPDSPPAFIYLDPPYRHSFTTYGTGFNDDDQEKVVEWMRRHADRGHTVWLSNRVSDGDTFFEDRLRDIADFHYFDVTYTAGRRKKTAAGFEAKPARECLIVATP